MKILQLVSTYVGHKAARWWSEQDHSFDFTNLPLLLNQTIIQWYFSPVTAEACSGNPNHLHLVTQAHLILTLNQWAFVRGAVLQLCRSALRSVRYKRPGSRTRSFFFQRWPNSGIHCTADTVSTVWLLSKREHLCFFGV